MIFFSSCLFIYLFIPVENFYSISRPLRVHSAEGEIWLLLFKCQLCNYTWSHELGQPCGLRPSDLWSGTDHTSLHRHMQTKWIRTLSTLHFQTTNPTHLAQAFLSQQSRFHVLQPSKIKSMWICKNKSKFFFLLGRCLWNCPVKHKINKKLTVARVVEKCELELSDWELKWLNPFLGQKQN